MEVFSERFQLCWICENAVPSLDGKRGCEWSRNDEPVKGWDAEQTYLNPQHTVSSYQVFGCPKFVPDGSNEIDTKMMPNNGFEELEVAIVKQAVADWKTLCKSGEKEYGSYNFRELRRFFRNNCGQIGQEVLKRLEEYRLECIEKEKEKKKKKEG